MTFTQLDIAFPTTSPINKKILSGQNRRLLDYLEQGNTIHCFHPAKRELKIGYLNSRASDLKKAGIILYKRRINVLNSEGESVAVTEYSLMPFK